MCVERGMFEEQAKEVVELTIPKIDAQDDYKTTWDRPANEYPDSLYAVMFLYVKETAKKWIEQNIPQAWFKPMFD